MVLWECDVAGKVISLRLKDQQFERLQRVARRLGHSPSESAVILLEEALRERDFAFVEFRDSPVGRQAYLKGTRLAVWQVVWLARHYDGDTMQTAGHLELPTNQVSAALTYAHAYPAEIEAALLDNAQAVDRLPGLRPGYEVVEVRATGP